MRVGAYDIIEPLGEGGMAEAFLARREGPGGVAKLCVVKRIRADLAGDARFVEAFFEEARVAMSLSHGGLVHTFDFGRDDTGTLFLAMEYADAGDLDALAVAVSRRGSVMPVAAACQILASVLAGLAAAHDARDAFGRPLSLVHRDISPSNILLTRAGEAKLADFGIARAADRVLSTAPGVVKGKAAYVAPEQLKGEPATPASDVYAAGVVLWEILAGRRLRGRGTLGDALAGLDNDVPRVDTIRKDVPRAIAEAVARATARDPKNRHPDAAAFRADLLDAARAANVVLDANAVALLVREYGDARGAKLGEATRRTSEYAIDAAQAAGSRASRWTRRALMALGGALALGAVAFFAWNARGVHSPAGAAVATGAPAEIIAPIAPGEAVIRVDEPAGAVFALEGAPIGIAPLTVRVALPEDGRRLHKLTATRAGVVSTRGVVLKPGQTRNVKTRLTSLARPLFPLPASDTERRVAGRTIAPGEELLLPAGLYRMEEKSGAVKYVRAGGRLKIED